MTVSENYSKYITQIGIEGLDKGTILEVNTNISIADEVKGNSVSLFDSDWMNGCLVAPLDKIDLEKYRGKILTQKAFFKFKSTRLGGNTAVNMPPGNGYLADPFVDAGIALTGVKTKSSYDVLDGVSYGPCYKSVGLGRWYSENIDDYTQTVIFQFGVPQFNSIFSFLANSCSFVDSYIARHGTYPSLMVEAKKYADLVRIVAMPFMSLVAWSLKLGYTLITGNKPFSYYYLKPAMNLYWSMVNDIANYFAIKAGLLNYVPDNDADKQIRTGAKDAKQTVTGNAFKLSNTSREIVQALYGGEKNPLNGEWIANDKNYIDVYDIVTRRNFVFNEMRRKFYQDSIKIGERKDEIDKVGEYDFSKDTSYEDVANYIGRTVMSTDAVNNFYNARSTGTKEITDELELNSGNSTDEGLSIFETKESEEKASPKNDKKNDQPKITDKESSTTTQGGYGFKSAPIEEKEDASGWDYLKYKVGSSLSNFTTAFSTSARGYSSRAVFSVNPVGSTTDTFTNTTSSIGTGDKVKSLSKAAQDYRFNLAGGQTGFETIDGVLDKMYQVGAGVLESWSFGASNIVNGLFFGGGYADIPEKWDDSSFSGTSVTYTMDLVAPYGNDYSRFHNLYVPLAMILAGALPRGTGKAAYVQPFNCSCYSKGTQHVSLGMITDVSVTNGITNQPYVLGMKSNSLRVTFTVKDLSSIISARVNTTTIFGNYTPVFEDDTPIARWVNKITSVNYDELAFVVPKIKTNLKIFGNTISSVYSAARLGHNLGNAFFEVDPIFYKNPNFSGFSRL